jgi:hypothetical protein
MYYEIYAVNLEVSRLSAMVKQVAVLLHIWEVLDLILSAEAGYPGQSYNSFLNAYRQVL